jgi:hypothetical protein
MSTFRWPNLAEQGLGCAVPAVGVRRVEQRDSGVDRGVHHRARPVNVKPAAEVVAAEPDDGHQQSG